MDLCWIPDLKRLIFRVYSKGMDSGLYLLSGGYKRERVEKIKILKSDSVNEQQISTARVLNVVRIRSSRDA